MNLLRAHWLLKCIASGGATGNVPIIVAVDSDNQPATTSATSTTTTSSVASKSRNDVADVLHKSAALPPVRTSGIVGTSSSPKKSVVVGSEIDASGFDANVQVTKVAEGGGEWIMGEVMDGKHSIPARFSEYCINTPSCIDTAGSDDDGKDSPIPIWGHTGSVFHLDEFSIRLEPSGFVLVISRMTQKSINCQSLYEYCPINKHSLIKKMLACFNGEAAPNDSGVYSRNCFIPPHQVTLLEQIKAQLKFDSSDVGRIPDAGTIIDAVPSSTLSASALLDQMDLNPPTSQDAGAYPPYDTVTQLHFDPDPQKTAFIPSVPPVKIEKPEKNVSAINPMIVNGKKYASASSSNDSPRSQSEDDDNDDEFLTQAPVSRHKPSSACPSPTKPKPETVYSTQRNTKALPLGAPHSESYKQKLSDLPPTQDASSQPVPTPPSSETALLSSTDSDTCMGAQPMDFSLPSQSEHRETGNEETQESPSLHAIARNHDLQRKNNEQQLQSSAKQVHPPHTARVTNNSTSSSSVQNKTGPTASSNLKPKPTTQRILPQKRPAKDEATAASAAASLSKKARALNTPPPKASEVIIIDNDEDPVSKPAARILPASQEKPKSGENTSASGPAQASAQMPHLLQQQSQSAAAAGNQNQGQLKLKLSKQGRLIPNTDDWLDQYDRAVASTPRKPPSSSTLSTSTSNSKV
ncbi:hypothetical protein Pelo_6480 [Pelomyxa schiedti]|nr:hypothetical protein Pelo_6480 [Pelomyxa schiedti]